MTVESDNETAVAGTSPKPSVFRARRKQAVTGAVLLALSAVVAVVLLVGRSQERAFGESLAKKSVIDAVNRYRQIVLEDAGTDAVVLEEWARALYETQLAGSSVELWAVGTSKQRLWVGESPSVGEVARRMTADLWDLEMIEARYPNGANACLVVKDLWEDASNVEDVVRTSACPVID